MSGEAGDQDLGHDLPLLRKQRNPLLCHRAPRPLEKRTFLLCTIRTFSSCGDTVSLFVSLLVDLPLAST